jgi:hypothetical protein
MSSRQLITDQLSPEATHLMAVGFRSKTPSAQLVMQIRNATGEVVSERTMARRKQEFEAEQQRRQSGREQMEDLLSAMRAGDATASEMVNALAMESLMRDPDGFAMLNPIDVQRTSIQAEKVRLQREKLELQKRQMALDEQKFELLKQQREQVLKAAEDLEQKVAGGKQITEDDLRKVKGIYGLNTD